MPIPGPDAAEDAPGGEDGVREEQGGLAAEEVAGLAVEGLAGALREDVGGDEPGGVGQGGEVRRDGLAGREDDGGVGLGEEYAFLGGKSVSCLRLLRMEEERGIRGREPRNSVGRTAQMARGEVATVSGLPSSLDVSELSIKCVVSLGGRFSSPSIV